LKTCDDWYITNGHFLLLDCLLTVFDEWYTVPIVKNSQKTVKTAQKCFGVNAGFLGVWSSEVFGGVCGFGVLGAWGCLGVLGCFGVTVKGLRG